MIPARHESGPPIHHRGPRPATTPAAAKPPEPSPEHSRRRIFLRRSDDEAEADRQHHARHRAIARAQLDAPLEPASVPHVEDVRRAARLWQRCPRPRYDDAAPTWTRNGIVAWAAAVAHMRSVGHDVRWAVPDSAREAWRRQRCGCGR